jgi:hypothetical protein
MLRGNCRCRITDRPYLHVHFPNGQRASVGLENYTHSTITCIILQAENVMMGSLLRRRFNNDVLSRRRVTWHHGGHGGRTRRNHHLAWYCAILRNCSQYSYRNRCESKLANSSQSGLFTCRRAIIWIQIRIPNRWLLPSP